MCDSYLYVGHFHISISLYNRCVEEFLIKSMADRVSQKFYYISLKTDEIIHLTYTTTHLVHLLGYIV